MLRKMATGPYVRISPLLTRGLVHQPGIRLRSSDSYGSPNFDVISNVKASEGVLPNMRHRIAEDAKPQLLLLLLATVITLVLWFMPFAEYLVYPIRLFVTFIHESSHALVAILTGGSVQSLTISMDGSGVVYSAPS